MSGGSTSFREADAVSYSEAASLPPEDNGDDTALGSGPGTRARVPVEFRQPDTVGPIAGAEMDWLVALRAEGGANSGVVSALRGFLLNGLRIALRDRRDVDEAQLEDFAQESLLRILNRLDQFEGRSRFTTWAHAIAINTAFTELRRKRWQDVSLETLLADGAQLGDPDILPDRALGSDEDRTRVIAALRRAIQEQLTDKQRAGIVGELREMPIDQIVDMLGTNRNAAYKLLHDARRALKNHLVAEGISAEDIRTAFAL